MHEGSYKSKTNKEAAATNGISSELLGVAGAETVFKLHPTFDPLLAEILRRDPDGVLVLIEGRVPMWTRLVREWIQSVMPDVYEDEGELRDLHGFLSKVIGA
jgi:hypothetical protein